MIQRTLFEAAKIQLFSIQNFNFEKKIKKLSGRRAKGERQRVKGLRQRAKG